MILQSLTAYYERIKEKTLNGDLDGKEKIAMQGWCTAKVSYAILLDSMGNIQGIMDMHIEEDTGKKKVLCPLVREEPEAVLRTNTPKSNFLCDNSKYILGIDKDGVNKGTKKCFEAAKEEHLEILKEIDNEESNAVKNFFATWNPDRAKGNAEIAANWEGITSGGKLVFLVNGIFPEEDVQIREAWMKYYQASKKDNAVIGTCLVTGEKTSIEKTHTKIKGVAGAQSSGAAIVSFNSASSVSYGKEQSYNAPVGSYAMFAYTTALNYLLSKKKYVERIGDITVIFWSEDADERCQDLFLAATDAKADNQELLKGVFNNLANGKAINVGTIEDTINLDQNFCILGLSPNNARLAVRFFYEDNFGKILQHIKKHYDRLNIVRPARDDTEYLGIWSLLQETVNKKSKDEKLNESMAGRVLESVLSDGRYPESLYNSVLMRVRAEQDDKDSHIYKITRGRAAIIKAYLLKNTSLFKGKGRSFVSLEEKCDDVAYVLGREFAILEEIQEKANKEVNSTIKDRYFNSACTTPAIVFPTLFRLKNSHIRKLSDSAAIYYENQLTELQGMLPAEGYPKQLNTKEQGEFIIGYYHQNQKRYEKKEGK